MPCAGSRWSGRGQGVKGAVDSSPAWYNGRRLGLVLDPDAFTRLTDVWLSGSCLDHGECE
jgi:hypothetical protein